MASLFSAVTRLIFSKKPQTGRMDEELGNTLGAGQTTVSSTLGVGSASQFISGEEHPLIRFRLVLGIHTPEHLGFNDNSPGVRPAPNLGIYHRVVYNEQKAKDSFKVFSIVINGCYFLQIIVAAALTALGAARNESNAVTVFGAINTIIAGFLTFLKGSGLPGRLKFYGKEWKKIREFIEQRERDFSRTDCDLNVNEVLKTIEQMYKNTEEDVDANTPDNYNSIMRNRSSDKDHVGGFDLSKLEGVLHKLKGLDGPIGSKVKTFAEGVERKTHGLAKDVQDHEKAIVEDVRDYKEKVAHDIEEHQSTMQQEARRRQQQVSQMYDDAARDAHDTARGATETARGVGEAARDVSEQARAERTRQEQALRDARDAVARLATVVEGRPSPSRPADDEKNDRTIP